MTIVALHYPVKMLSLSPSALDRAEGIWHYVKSIDGPALTRFQGEWDEDPDAVLVETLCGKDIHGYPETPQRHQRPCVRCIKSWLAPASWSRIIPPVDQSWDRWARYYWGTGGSDIRSGGLFA